MSTTPIADMVEKMLAESVAPPVVVLAVRTIEMSRVGPGHVRDKREYERDRKRNWRNKFNTLPEANDAGLKVVCPENVPDNGDKRCDLSFLSSSIGATKKEGRKQKEGARARGTRMQVGAQIPDADRQFARDNGMDEAAIDHAWAEFIDYWIGIPGQRGTKLNWSATWRNRVRQISARGGSTGPPRRAPATQPSFREIAANLRTQNATPAPRPDKDPEIDGAVDRNLFDHDVPVKQSHR